MGVTFQTHRTPGREEICSVVRINMQKQVGGGSKTSQVGVTAEKGAETILTWLPYPPGGGGDIGENGA